MKLTYLYLFTMVAMLASTTLAVAEEPSASAIATRLAQAETLHAQAQAADHGWVATSKLIMDARAALARNELVEAAALSRRALQTSTASVAQAQQEQLAWKARVPGRENK